MNAPAPRPAAPSPRPAAQPQHAAPARPRLVTRRMLSWSVLAGTGLTGWAYWDGYSPGAGFAGKALDFLITWLLITALTVVALTVLRHGFHPARRAAGRGARSGWRAGRARGRAWLARLTDPGPAIPGPGGTGDDGDPGDDDALAVVHSFPPRRFPRPPSGAAAGPGRSPAHWQRAQATVADMDPARHAELAAAIDGEAAGLTGYAGALRGLHDHLIEQTGMDPKSLAALEQAADAIVGAGAAVRAAGKVIALFYGDQIDFAESGNKTPHDGHFFEDA